MRAALTAIALTVGLGTLGYACVFSETTITRPGDDQTSTTESSSTSGGGSFDRDAMLADLADNVFVATYAELVAATAVLETATAAYRDTLSVEDRDAARQAWRDVMDVWQRAELMQIGPAGVSGVAAGGQDLRDQIYSWTLVNRCATDQVVVSRAFADKSTFASQLVNVRGLDAMEYLLFNDSSANTCAPQVPINADGTWDALTDLAQRRADYAAALADLVHDHATTLHAAWTDGGFASELGGGGSTYASAQVALNAVSDAMFYLEVKTKDVKLAVPTGLSPDCESDTCPQDLELRFAAHSKAAIRENIDGFELIFTGADGLGFDDWLSAVGAADLSTTMTEKITAARDAVDAIDESDLASALSDDPQSVEDVYFALKDIADLLKSDFISTLDLDLPQAVQGDND